MMEEFNRGNCRGVTLAELLISIAVLGGGIAVAVGGFSNIQKSIQYSKSRTLATNLAQEKMQILKQSSYNRLMVSTATAYRTDFNPSIPYDPGYYPPEAILEGGVHFTRITYVQVAQEDSGNLSTLAATTPDTGMKLVTVTVVWNQGATNRKVQILAVDSNPDTVMNNATLRGVVRSSATGAGIPYALVTVAENVGWRDTANAAGSYSVNLSPGTFDIVATADGYFPARLSMSFAPNAAPYNQDFNLTPKSSSTLRGAAWINPSFVISQVVASSVTDRDYEYIELYNPSTSTYIVGPNRLWIGYCDSSFNCGSNYITTATNSISPNQFFLIANTLDTVQIGGVIRNVDGYYSNASFQYPNHLITAGQAGALYIWHNSPTSGWYQLGRFGWYNGATAPPVSLVETQGAAGSGLPAGEQYVRRTGTSTYDASYGPAYDSDNNSVDFINNHTLAVNPSNSSVTKIPVSGFPAVGAIVTASDGLSNPTTAYLKGNPPYAEFMLPGVATGTWAMIVSSSTAALEISSISALTANTTTWVPNATTSPAWPAVGYPQAVLSVNETRGYVSGRITDAYSSVITGITVGIQGGTPIPAGSNGYFLLSASPGIYTVTANPGNASGAYVSQDQTPVTVNLGQVTSDVNFMLSQGGRISGFVTRDGLNALPGIGVAAINSNGEAVDQEVSNVNGRYTLVNLATGTYTVQPVLDMSETTSPSASTVTVTAGATVVAATFTITGAYGTITGGVSVSSDIIKTGVLIIVSTQGIAGSPPALSSSTLAGAPYYSANSSEDGTYSVSVRGSTTTYRVSAFYPQMNGSTVTISTKVVTGVTVTAGVTTTGVNFTW
jgi:hypothetical protein